MKKIALSQGRYALVDDRDFEKLNKSKWSACRDGNTFYAGKQTKSLNGKRTIVQMHRIIMNTPSGMETDHINGNGLDNRRENLRICTHSENMRNKGKLKSNTSGYKGVCWNKRNKKWEVKIMVNKKSIFLGYYITKELAYESYIKTCTKLHKGFANY